MAVVKYRNSDNLKLATVTDLRAGRLSDDLNSGAERSETQVINYDVLKELCTINGLGNPHDVISSEVAHYEFMSRYREMFSPSKRDRGPSQLTFDSLAKRPVQCSRACASQLDCDQHNKDDVIQHFKKTRSRVEDVDPAKEKVAQITILRKLLKRKMVDRTRDENRQIHGALKKLSVNPCTENEPEILKELSFVAQLETWDEPNIDIDAEAGFYLILSGSVRTSHVVIAKRTKSRHQKAAQQEKAEQKFDSKTLVAGDSFGSLEKLGDADIDRKSIHSVVTIEPCEFLFISSADHERVMQKLQHKRELEKLGMLENCKLFSGWSKQPLNSVAGLIRWAKFPGGDVLMKEGEVTEYLAIVKSGVCRILSHIDTVVTLPNDAKEKHRRTIEVTRVGTLDTFGETSALFGQPMTYTVVTSGPVELAVIDAVRLCELDPVVLQLFKQSSEKVSRIISQEAVEEEYVKQERKDQWKQTKAKVLEESLRYCGIRPGFGKWKK